MELKTSYQYTYFIYPFAIKKESYKEYVQYLMKSKSYQIKLFDSFTNDSFFKYFVPTVRKSIFQNLNFHQENKTAFYQLSRKQQAKKMSEQKCLMFEYVMEKEIQGKLKEKDGIFFTIPKIELICFQNGICFLLIKTHLIETNSLTDVLNFNYQFQKMTIEKQNIKMQNNEFENMDTISQIIEEVTGHPFESKKIDRNDQAFLVYTYVCLDASYWNRNENFENIENEFIKLAEIKQSDAKINVDYEKLSILSNSQYMKLRVSNKSSALICSSTDANNYTKLAEKYENEYLYTYLIALHQKYYLKKLNYSFNEKKPQKSIQELLNFTKNIWISEITDDDFGQKIYKRCREKFNLEELFYEIKCKYDIYYKQQNIEKTKKWNKLLIILSIILGISHIFVWNFIS